MEYPHLYYVGSSTVEQGTHKPLVAGSSPALATQYFIKIPMATYDQKIIIQAPPEFVWTEVCRANEKRRIVTQRNCFYVLACDGDQGIVFSFFEQPDGSTRLRRFVDNPRRLEEGLAAKGPDALDDLAARGIFSTPISEQDGDHELEKIRADAEKAANDSQRVPRSRTLVYPEASRLTEHQAVRIDLPPWNPIYFLWLAMVFSVAASGMLAAFNWPRLGHKLRIWATLAFTLEGIIILVLILSSVKETLTFWWVFCYLLNVGMAGLLAAWQAQPYRAWVATLGKPIHKKSSMLVPLMTGFAAWLLIIMIYFTRSWSIWIAFFLPLAVPIYLRLKGLERLIQGIDRLSAKSTDLRKKQSDGSFSGSFPQRDSQTNRPIQQANPRMNVPEKAYTSEPLNAESYLMRGLFYSSQGETGKAIVDIEKALRLGLSKGNQVFAEDELKKLKVKKKGF